MYLNVTDGNPVRVAASFFVESSFRRYTLHNRTFAKAEKKDVFQNRNVPTDNGFSLPPTRSDTTSTILKIVSIRRPCSSEVAPVRPVFGVESVGRGDTSLYATLPVVKRIVSSSPGYFWSPIDKRVSLRRRWFRFRVRGIRRVTDYSADKDEIADDQNVYRY